MACLYADVYVQPTCVFGTIVELLTVECLWRTQRPPPCPWLQQASVGLSSRAADVAWDRRTGRAQVTARRVISRGQQKSRGATGNLNALSERVHDPIKRRTIRPPLSQGAISCRWLLVHQLLDYWISNEHLQYIHSLVPLNVMRLSSIRDLMFPPTVYCTIRESMYSIRECLYQLMGANWQMYWLIQVR